jgi:hypothetical protein
MTAAAMSLLAMRFLLRRKDHIPLQTMLAERRYRWPKLQKRKFQRQ